MDFLIAEILLWGRARGYREGGLGMAPLSGLSEHHLAPAWHKLGGFIWRHGEAYYNFEGLRRYKQKFAPEWRPRYLAAPSGLRMPRALLEVSRLIAASARPAVPAKS
jgi:phosphatidylglycerol lysyltransferase